MTIKEAKEFFGLKETDTVYAKGIRQLVEVNNRRIGLSLSSYDREKLAEEIEALNVLLRIAE